MSKSISRFEPTPSQSRTECERHYTEVHVPMAQNFLRPMDGLLSYHTSRAVAQIDVGGGWAQRPRAWRFVVLRLQAGAALAFTEAQNDTIANDHVNCLYRLRHCDVEESVLFDRLDGQLALSKFLIEADRVPGASAEEGWAALRRIAERVGELMAGSFGARRLYLNRALNELRCEPVDVEGQRPVGLLDETTRVGYIEAYFDHSYGAVRPLAR